MKKFTSLPPAGTKDFLPQELKNRQIVINMARELFESFGFLPIDTPAFERIETLMKKYGKESEKLIFKILKRGKEEAIGKTDLALRYDLTVPLARFYSQYHTQLPSPFRRYQIGPVWRAERPGKDRFREFYQADIDIIGSSSLLADAEIIIAISKLLSRLNLTDYTILVNSRKVLAGFLKIYCLPENLKKATLIALDKLNKIGVNGVIKELREAGLPQKTITKIKSDLSKKSEALKNQLKKTVIGKKGLKEVEEIILLTKPFIKKGEIRFSPFLVRGLDYYTGPIFEIYLKGVSGAIAGGGRYDNLIKIFTGKQTPASGGTLGIDRLLSILSKTKKGNKKELSSSRVFITLWDYNLRVDILNIAENFRKAGFLVEISLKEGKIGEQVRSALKRGVRYCIFYGPDEKAKNLLTLKDLLTNKQITANFNEIIKELKHNSSFSSNSPKDKMDF